MARPLSLALGGTVALLATAAVIGLQIFTAAHSTSTDRALLKPVTIAAAVLQSAVLVIVCCLVASRIWRVGQAPSIRCLVFLAATQLLLCAVAAAVSAAALALLSNPRVQEASADYQAGLLAGLSVVVALATISQLSFIVLHFVSSRDILTRDGNSSDMPFDGRKARCPRVKAIPYAQTRSDSRDSVREKSPIRRPPPLIIAEPNSCKTSFFGSSFSRVIRPSSSKTKLLPCAERRFSSRESTPRRSSFEESSFDSWDTSSVDAHNRQVVLEMSSSPSNKPGFLETIPASPRPSRSPSLRTPKDMEPPRSVRTCRSFSHGTFKQREDGRLTASSSVSELHIHPLFRSDSASPAPLVSPGTTVLASPIAGQVITRRESMQSLARMRSGSFRTALSHQASFDSTKLKMQSDAQQVDECEEDEEQQRQQQEQDKPGTRERRMTPPVPDWLLSPDLQANLDNAAEKASRAEAGE
ncbi:hypothetical protein HIM_01685 [Hirsutella minnesotensis 3608]|nr:hypothetical protein HIM_01685 [Hirsutella minnesotensis 3608]